MNDDADDADAKLLRVFNRAVLVLIKLRFWSETWEGADWQRNMWCHLVWRKALLAEKDGNV